MLPPRTLRTAWHLPTLVGQAGGAEESQDQGQDEVRHADTARAGGAGGAGGGGGQTENTITLCRSPNDWEREGASTVHTAWSFLASITSTNNNTTNTNNYESSFNIEIFYLQVSKQTTFNASKENWANIRIKNLKLNGKYVLIHKSAIKF